MVWNYFQLEEMGLLNSGIYPKAHVSIRLRNMRAEYGHLTTQITCKMVNPLYSLEASDSILTIWEDKTQEHETEKRAEQHRLLIER